MSKSLPTFAWLLVACGPVTTSVVELRDSETPRASDKPDARVITPDAKGSSPPDADGCLTFVDQTLPELVADAAVVAEREVVARAASSQGCSDMDAGVQLLQTTLYERRDGEPLVQRGQTYSWRWNALTTMVKRMRLVGGERVCASETVVDREFDGLLTSPLGLASCYEFTSPIDAHYLQTNGAQDYPASSLVAFGVAPPSFSLCAAPCEPGTAHEFAQDAGPPPAYDAAIPAYDAAIPGVPP